MLNREIEQNIKEFAGGLAEIGQRTQEHTDNLSVVNQKVEEHTNRLDVVETGVESWENFKSNGGEINGDITLNGAINLGKCLKETNGYSTLPNGLIIQWGTVTLQANSSSSTFALPITFSNANLNAQVTVLDNSNVSSSSACRLLNFTNTSIMIANSINTSLKATYLCVGY